VLSEEEISGLLSDTAYPLEEGNYTDNPEEEGLIESLSRLESIIKERRDASLKEGVYLSLPYLSRLFRLSHFEEMCLVACLAPEVDSRYERLYSYLQDDVTRRKPSVDLVLNLLCHGAEERLASRSAFDPRAPLLRYRLLQISDSSTDGPMPLLSRFLKLDDRVVNLLLGFDHIDARLNSLARLIPPKTGFGSLSVNEEVKNRIQTFILSHFTESSPDGKNVVFYLYGPSGVGKRSLTEAVCSGLGLTLVMGDMEKALNGHMPFDEVVCLLGREAVLQQAALCLENFDSLLIGDDRYEQRLMSFFDAIRTFSRLTFLLGRRPWRPQGLLNDHVFIDVGFSTPNYGERRRLWEDHLGGHYRLSEDVDLGTLASEFRFTSGQIRDAIVTAENLARWRSSDGEITMADLHSACRAQSNQRLGALTRKIETKYTWDDIVLPSDQMNQLRDICNQAKYRHIVYGEWGFDRTISLGRGLNVLFSGPSGTGKTMAAEIISNELGLDLYKIDLSRIVSKYIGETEKNLDRIFTEAETSNAILFFDEADALFGKRSEVKDAHDRYANIEIGYLLQKMEEYEGITILATNLRQNMDEAFVRRIHVIVEFPFPNEEYRRRIWEVVFPSEAPLGSDIDFGVLAREVKLPGGNIKNIALTAAFYAARDGGVIQMMHLMQAVRQEYRKLGRIKWNESQWST
jgi:ATP-dependent 26S proteasome regulatory subunit